MSDIQTEQNAPENEQSDDISDAPKMATQSDVYFSKDLQIILEKAEHLRLERMKQYEMRGFLSFYLGMAFMLIGSSGFAWLFFMEADLMKGTMALIAGMAPSYLLHQYKMTPLNNYKREHKEVFIPALGRAMGNLRYRATSGIKASRIRPARILPAYDSYKAEDCFYGRHKNIKLMMSEARMQAPKQKGKGLSFDGIFVLLELPEPTFTGHTIIMSDLRQANEWARHRWKDLSHVETGSERVNARFEVYSDKPEEAQKIAREDILERFDELAKSFDNAKISAAFYQEKYVFLMIPYTPDMFEHSDLYVPVTTKEDAMTRKKEIEQIIAIIDIIAVYAETGE